MKKLINILATVVLATSSVPFLAKQYIKTELQDTPKQYQEQTQHYDVGENQNLPTGQQYSKNFHDWINGNDPATKGHYNSWDSYLHQFNESGDTMGVNPIKATVGGGVFLNQSESGGESFVPQYQNDNAIGSFGYKTYKKTPHVKTPAERHTDVNTDLTVNDLTPNKNPDQTNPNTNKNMNKFIDGYLTAVLNYWYYLHFGDEIESTMDPNDYALKKEQYTDFYNDVLSPYLSKLLIFEFGAQWNDREKVTSEENNYEKVGENIVDLLLDGASEFGDKAGWGWVASFAEIGLGWLLDAALTHYETVNHEFKYVSPPFDLITIQSIFNDILGGSIGTLPVNGLIQQFINKNGAYPDHLTLNNFNFNVNNYKINNIQQTSPTEGILTSNTNINTSKITPHMSFDIYADKATPSYTQQKDEIDDPAEGSYNGPEQVNTGGATVKPSEWKDYQMVEQLNSAWNFESFSQYVSYVPINTLVPNTPVKEKLLCPLLGYTKNNPRYFYVEAQ